MICDNKLTQAWQKLLAIMMVLVFVSSVSAQNKRKPELELSPDDNQLVDKDPFDRIYLDDYNEYRTMDIVPPEKAPPNPLPRNGLLVFEWVEDDEFKFDVPWSVILEYKTFTGMLLEEADMLLAEKKYARAFRNLLFVYDNGGRNNRQLEAQLRKILLLDGRQNFENQNFSLALSIFEDVYQRDRNAKVGAVSAIRMIMQCYERMLVERFEVGNFDGVRSVLDSVYRRYGQDVESLKNKWDAQLVAKNAEYLGEATNAMQSGDARAAHLAARKALFALPGDPKTIELLNQIIGKFPAVYVGVSQTSLNGGDPTRIEHWAARRMGRLTQRSIIEFDGLTDEGGKYQFLNGEFVSVDEDGMKYQFRISDEERRFGIPAVSAYQIAQQLLDRADENSPAHHEAWAKVVDTVSIDSPSVVSFNLRIPFVRPDSLLQMPYVPNEDGQALQNGPYIVQSQNETQTIFQKNPNYQQKTESQYPDLVELKYDNPSDAVDALLKGDIDVVDRVPIADLRALSRNPDIQLRKYIVPTIHMIVPNINKKIEPWEASRSYQTGDVVRLVGVKLNVRCSQGGVSATEEPKEPGDDGSVKWEVDTSNFIRDLTFRNAMFRSLDRTRLINEVIAGGREVSGCEVINGPFPIGTEDNDQIGYAYNVKLGVVPYNRPLGLVLAEVVRNQMVDRLREKQVSNPEIAIPEFTLAFPKGEMPRSVCNSIKLMWADIKVKVNLRELPDGEIKPQDDNYDFLYVELSMSEPLTDVDVLFGRNGIATQMSPSVQQLVRDLSYSTSWPVAGRKLRQLHRQVLNDISVMPLYQVQEYFAYRKNITEIGRNLVNLYQNIDLWKVVPWEIPTEEE